MTSRRYEFVITRSARRQLTERIPEAIAIAGYDFIQGPLVENPRRVGKRLMPPFDDRYSARRGTYRILYRIEEDARVVTVIAAGHRSEIYRRP